MSFPRHLLVFAALAGASASLHAITFTWNSTATSGNMTNNANWSGGVAPTSGGTLTFSSSNITSIVNDFSSVINVTSLTIGNGFTLSGNAFKMGGTITSNGSTIAPVINTNIVLGANTTVSTPNSNALTIAGVISGLYKLTESGAGTLTLSGANTYRGGTQVNNGLILLSGSGTLGNNSNALTFSQITGAVDLDGTNQNIGSLSGTGAGIFNNASGTISTLTIGNGKTGGTTFSGVISDHTSGTGTVALTKTGSGTITFSGANAYSGATTISGGTLQFGAANVISSASALTLSGGTIATGGYSQTLGGLTLLANSTIDFGSGTGAVAFADSSAFNWTGTLSLINFTTGATLRFGTSSSALTATQLSEINFGSGLTAQIDSNGYVSAASAIPEPGTCAALFGLGALGFAGWRRRTRAATV